MQTGKKGRQQSCPRIGIYASDAGSYLNIGSYTFGTGPYPLPHFNKHLSRAQSRPTTIAQTTALWAEGPDTVSIGPCHLGIGPYYLDCYPGRNRAVLHYMAKRDRCLLFLPICDSRETEHAIRGLVFKGRGLSDRGLR